MAELKEMVAAKKQTAHLLGKKYKPRKVKRTNYPVALQVSYRKKMMAMVAETDRLIKEVLIPELDRLYQEARNQRMDAYTYPDDVTELMNIIRATYADTYSEAEVQAIASEQAQAVSGFNRRQMTRSFSNALGVELFYNEPWLEAEMQSFTKTNVDLITSIPEKYLQDVESLVQRGLKSGRSVRDLQKDLTARYKGALKNKPRNRAELIARDQTMKLNGDLNHLRQTNLGIEKYTWRTSHDERVRPSHAALDGEVFKWSDPPEVGHPGEDFQCVPSETKIICPVDIERLYRRRYTGKLVELTTSSGHVIKCTSNHPVFTGQAFIAADSLNIGDNVFKIHSEGFLAGIANPQDEIPGIDKLFGFFEIFNPFERMAGKLKDFHGDGIIDEQVDIVTIKSELWNDIKPDIFKRVLNDLFAEADKRLAFLPCDAKTLKMLAALGFTATCSVRFFSKLFSFRTGQIRESDNICLRTIAELNAVFGKPIDNGMSGYSILFGKGKNAFTADMLFDNSFYRKLFEIMRMTRMFDNRLAGCPDGFGKVIRINSLKLGNLVETHSIPHKLDTIIDKKSSEYSGHVYNLQTVNGWYIISEDYILSNCRCTAEPIIDI